MVVVVESSGIVFTLEFAQFMALWRKVYVAVREVNEMKVDRWILSLLTLGTNYPQRDGMR